MTHNIDTINAEFYDLSGDRFDAIPFEYLLPKLLDKYLKGDTVLEIGSGPGALAAFLQKKGYEMTCIEPSNVLAERARQKGLKVQAVTFQNFESEERFDCTMAFSSLIHIPKKDLPAQISKIARLLNPQGLFFVSFLEGEEEGFEDPTKSGKVRFFAKWNETALNSLTKSDFQLLESHKISNQKMDRTFILSVYQRAY